MVEFQTLNSTRKYFNPTFFTVLLKGFRLLFTCLDHLGECLKLGLSDCVIIMIALRIGITMVIYPITAEILTG